MNNNQSGKNEVKVGISLQADLKPVLESAPNGFKRVFQVLLGGRHARVERQRRLIEAQTDIDIQKILSGEVQYNPSKDSLLQLPASSLANLIINDIHEEETSNLLTCSMHAALTLEETGDKTNQPDASRDFILKWRNEAQMISDETAQAIWGRILAEEIQSPGSISNRTLDIIRNLSKYEAATFNKACSLIAFDKYLVDNKKGDSIKPEEYAALRDSGLIASYTNGIYRSSKWIDTTITMPDGTKVLAYYIRIKNLFIFQKKIEGQPIEAPTFSYWELTTAAMELYKIIKIDPLEKVHDIKNTLIKEDSKGDVFFTTYTDLEKQLVDLENIRKL